MRTLHPPRGSFPTPLLSGLLFAAGLPVATLAQSTPVERTEPADPIAAYVTEASQRFGIPAASIRAVIRVESTGDARATSRAGAMGLMQIMPATWAALRSHLPLGNDPYDPRDNILAGTAYLREMLDRYGSPGFLAAYNAGPGRYHEYLAGGRALPSETRLTSQPLHLSVAAARSPELSRLPPPIRWRGRAHRCSSHAPTARPLPIMYRPGAVLTTLRRRVRCGTCPRSRRYFPACSSRDPTVEGRDDTASTGARSRVSRRIKECAEGEARQHDRTMAG